LALNAGDITFTILANDAQFRSTMAGASKAIGAAMTAAGAAITGFAAVSIRDFAQAGDEVQKMAERTGFSTERLSELRHAAELSGTGLDSIEKASKKLSTTITEAGNGTQTYVDALGAVGLNYEQLQGLSPEQQFNMVALALADVGDKTTQVAVAQELFGRAGTQLLPMLANGSAGLREMSEEAHRLGIVFDQESANKAANFNDAMQRMGESFTSFKYDVAEALIPIIIDLMNWVQAAMVSFREWRDANPGLFESLTKITVVIGAIMTVLGPLLVMLPGLATAWSAVSAAVSAFLAVAGAIAAAVSAPVTLVVAAIAGLVLAAWYFVDDWGAVWETAKSIVVSAVQFIVSVLTPVFEMIGALMNMGRSLGDTIGGFFGSSGYGGVNQDALDRYNQNTGANFSTVPGARGATAGGGSGGGVTIQNLMVVTNDPNQASRDIGQNLFSALLAAGVPL